MNIKITSCIVLYKNDINMLRQAISSFLNTDLNVKLFLIDNSPSDELKILKTDSRIDYFHNPSNPGFGTAHNMAIRKAFKFDSQYHLILNPDIYFDKGTLEGLCEFMDNQAEVGHVMPKVLYPSGELQYLCKTNPTMLDMFIRSFMPNFMTPLFKERIIRYEYRDKNYDEIMYDIPYLSGCFMFLRTSILKKVGFFDERIFMYFEDTDLTRRFFNISKTAYYPIVQVYHHFGKFTHKKLKFKLITIQSAIIYFRKWGFLKSLF